MQTSMIVVDDFYSNPDEVRAFALAQPFDVKGNYPGARTKPFLNDSIKASIQAVVQAAGGNVTDWLEQHQYTGTFQLCTAEDRTWIHPDHFNTWAAVCYLTPDAPLSSGTGLYRHKATGEYRRTTEDLHEGRDYTKWELVDRVGNRYNRLVMYRGDLFHASLDYFGDKPENARLFQTFFFNTEY